MDDGDLIIGVVVWFALAYLVSYLWDKLNAFIGKSDQDNKDEHDPY